MKFNLWKLGTSFLSLGFLLITSSQLSLEGRSVDELGQTTINPYDGRVRTHVICLADQSGDEIDGPVCASGQASVCKANQTLHRQLLHNALSSLTNACKAENKCNDVKCLWKKPVCSVDEPSDFNSAEGCAALNQNCDSPTYSFKWENGSCLCNVDPNYLGSCNAPYFDFSGNPLPAGADACRHHSEGERLQFQQAKAAAEGHNNDPTCSGYQVLIPPLPAECSTTLPAECTP